MGGLTARTGIGAAAAVAAHLLPSGAGAHTTVHGFGPDPRSGGPGGVNVAGSRSGERIAISYSHGAFRIADPDGVSAGGRACERIRRTLASCDKPADSQLYSHTRGGNDRVRIATLPTLGSTRSNSLLGPGADRFKGGVGDDVVDGGPGPDLLRGRGGGDEIFGGIGGDTASGGSGNDSLFMQDGFRRHPDADRAIDCGDGDGDFASVDRRGDPKPAGCESVRAS